jgi:uncharacterized protein YjaG (DUF416 family)
MLLQARIQDDVRSLDDASIAIFFTCAAERFAPLYADFCAKHSFGNPEMYREMLNGVWIRLRGDAIELPETLDLETLIPQADDFPSIEVTLAQNAVILLDAALAWTIQREDRTVEWTDFALEGMRMVALDRELGVIDTGDQPVSQEMEEKIANDPAISEELALEQEDLESVKGEVSKDRLEEMRESAVSHAWRLNVVVG